MGSIHEDNCPAFALESKFSGMAGFAGTSRITICLSNPIASAGGQSGGNFSLYAGAVLVDPCVSGERIRTCRRLAPSCAPKSPMPNPPYHANACGLKREAYRDVYVLPIFSLHRVADPLPIFSIACSGGAVTIDPTCSGTAARKIASPPSKCSWRSPGPRCHLCSAVRPLRV
jgi:hypothetical protein